MTMREMNTASVYTYVCRTLYDVRRCVERYGYTFNICGHRHHRQTLDTPQVHNERMKNTFWILKWPCINRGLNRIRCRNWKSIFVVIIWSSRRSFTVASVIGAALNVEDRSWMRDADCSCLLLKLVNDGHRTLFLPLSDTVATFTADHIVLSLIVLNQYQFVCRNRASHLKSKHQLNHLPLVLFFLCPTHTQQQFTCQIKEPHAIQCSHVVDNFFGESLCIQTPWIIWYRTQYVYRQFRLFVYARSKHTHRHRSSNQEY